jgi:hypothetical protein
MTEDIDALGFQHGHQPDEGQPDEGAGVVALQPLEQGDAQPLGLEAARALVGPFPVQVAGDLVLGQGAEVDPKGLTGDLGPAGGAVQEAQPV